MISTLQELRTAHDTVNDRLVAAVMAGDADQVAAIEAERAALPLRLFAAEVAHLQAEIAEVKDHLAEAKVAEREAAAPARAMREKILDLQKELALLDRAAGMAANEVGRCRSDLAILENRLQKLVDDQAGRAYIAQAPVMHSLWHMPAPK